MNYLFICCRQICLFVACVFTNEHINKYIHYLVNYEAYALKICAEMLFCILFYCNSSCYTCEMCAYMVYCVVDYEYVM